MSLTLVDPAYYVSYCSGNAYAFAVAVRMRASRSLHRPFNLENWVAWAYVAHCMHTMCFLFCMFVCVVIIMFLMLSWWLLPEVKFA